MARGEVPVVERSSGGVRGLPALSLGFARRLSRSMLGSGGTLSQRAIRGGFWAFAWYGSDRFLMLLRSVILARLLQPADFGLMGLAQISIGFLTIMTETGIAPALIHDREANKDTLYTAWTISVLRGLLLSVAAFSSAGLIAAFFAEPALLPVLRVMALAFVITGLTNTGLILLQKEMDFRRLAVVNLGASILGLIVAVLAALLMKSVWALVISSLVQSLAVLIGSYAAHSLRPRFCWHRPSAAALLGYGKFVFAGGIVNYLLTQGDNALVGKLLGAGQLGLYSMAYNIANMPTTSVTHVVGTVAFPAYAKLQDNVVALREAYRRILKMIGLVTVPMVGGLFILAPEFVPLLFGEKWLPMVAPFQILCVYGLERAVNASVGPLFQAIGRPQVPLYLTLFKLLVLAAIIFPLTAGYGILGTSIAGSIAAVIVCANALIPVSRALRCRIGSLLSPLVSPFAATGFMVVSLLLFKAAGWSGQNLFALFGLVTAGALIYLVAIYVLDRPALHDIKRLILAQVG